MSIRIGIVGMAGRMGQLLIEETAAAGAVCVGGTLRVGGKAAPSGLQSFPDIASLFGASDVVSDFTHADTAATLAATLVYPAFTAALASATLTATVAYTIATSAPPTAAALAPCLVRSRRRTSPATTTSTCCLGTMAVPAECCSMRATAPSRRASHCPAAARSRVQSWRRRQRGPRRVLDVLA